MFADFCSLFLEHGPHSRQRQLLEDVLQLLWWAGHFSNDPPFEQGEKGPGQVPGDHWQGNRRRTFFRAEGGEGRFNRLTEGRRLPTRARSPGLASAPENADSEIDRYAQTAPDWARSAVLRLDGRSGA